MRAGFAAFEPTLPGPCVHLKTSTRVICSQQTPSAHAQPKSAHQPRHTCNALKRTAVRSSAFEGLTQESTLPPAPIPDPTATVDAPKASSSSGKRLTRSLPRRLQGLLPWGEVIPLASRLDGAALEATDSIDYYDLGDGMAATEAASSIADAAASATKRRRRMRSTLPLAETLEHRPVRVEHATLQVLRQRALGGSLPGARRDPFKLGLVVEGGGMRGCVSGGALQALADLGLLNIFDSVYGSSAGAINLTFFLSGQRDGVRIYHDHIANEDFVDLRRLFSRRPEQSPALNLPYLLEHVMEKVQPLDYDAVLSSQIPLKVVASSLDTLNPVLLDNFQDKHDLRLALQASATVPAVAGGPVHYRGQRLVDAAVFEPVPFRSAIADGCTHVLVLCTRPAPPARRSVWADAFSDAVESAVKRAVMSPEYMVPAWQAEVEALAKDGITQDEMLRRSLDDGAEELPWFAGTHVYPVYPHPAGCSFSPLCIDVNTLKSGVAEGRRAVLNVARAALGDALDFSRLVGQEAANIVPVTAMSQGQLTTGAGRRLLREHYVFNGRR